MLWTEFSSSLTAAMNWLFSCISSIFTFINRYPVIYVGFALIVVAPLFTVLIGRIADYLTVRDNELQYSRWADGRMRSIYRDMRFNYEHNNELQALRTQKKLNNIIADTAFEKDHSIEIIDLAVAKKANRVKSDMQFARNNEELLYQQYSDNRNRQERFNTRYKIEQAAYSALENEYSNKPLVTVEDVNLDVTAD